jgi:hypothetical protein
MRTRLCPLDEVIEHGGVALDGFFRDEVGVSGSWLSKGTDFSSYPNIKKGVLHMAPNSPRKLGNRRNL